MQRSASGQLIADPQVSAFATVCVGLSFQASMAPDTDGQRFPDGIAKLSSYVHALGLRLGIYEDAGNLTW